MQCPHWIEQNHPNTKIIKFTGINKLIEEKNTPHLQLSGKNFKLTPKLKPSHKMQKPQAVSKLLFYLKWAQKPGTQNWRDKEDTEISWCIFSDHQSLPGPHTDRVTLYKPDSCAAHAQANDNIRQTIFMASFVKRETLISLKTDLNVVSVFARLLHFI